MAVWVVRVGLWSFQSCTVGEYSRDLGWHDKKKGFAGCVRRGVSRERAESISTASLIATDWVPGTSSSTLLRSCPLMARNRWLGPGPMQRQGYNTMSWWTRPSGSDLAGGLVRDRNRWARKCRQGMHEVMEWAGRPASQVLHMAGTGAGVTDKTLSCHLVNRGM